MLFNKETVDIPLLVEYDCSTWLFSESRYDASSLILYQIIQKSPNPSCS